MYVAANVPAPSRAKQALAVYEQAVYEKALDLPARIRNVIAAVLRSRRRRERNIPNSALDPAYVGSVHSDVGREGILSQAAILAELPESQPEPGLDV